MTRYRSLETKEAVQYLGDPIPGVTCSGVDADYTANGCDSSRRHMPHVHTAAVGGMNVLKPSDWIMPVPGGPFVVVEDALFRVYFEVPVYYSFAGDGEMTIVTPASAPALPAPESQPVRRLGRLVPDRDE